ncbi:MAG TPA: KpsF/GutQ family sugar-phosphate isomerase [Gemmataceae bacterium]|nr:KpsF/GutQ family sugar-phosphate isomerase [Gemmataceae bacterium]
MFGTVAPARLSTTILEQAREVMRAEAGALEQVAEDLNEGFERVVEVLRNCAGRVAITGVGKCADIGRKIAATFNSTGTRAYFLDATQAMHGDLGMVHADDVALVLSHSGDSEEIVRLLRPLRNLAAALLAITGNGAGQVARAADASIIYGSLTEACPLSLAPSTSTTVMLALGDALAFVLCRQREFGAQDFARFHPAGNLGRKLALVTDYMRSGSALRVASDSASVRSVLARTGRRGRRTGAVMLVDQQGRLSGIFTDSDLARLFERRAEHLLDRPICEVMTRQPLSVPQGAKFTEALELLRSHKISELPVLDNNGRPVGLLDITDLLEFLPLDEQADFEEEESWNEAEFRAA